MGDERDNMNNTNSNLNVDNKNYLNQQNMYSGENPKSVGKILKPIVQEKIVKVPVTQYVEKIVEKEEIKYINKYVDVIKPIITYKTKHIAKPIYLDKIKYETKILEKEKIIHIPKIEYKNKIVEVPIYVHREKIIEKKVPMIIERVIPVLKVKTQEKNVLSDTIEISEICDMSQNENRIRNLRISSESHLGETCNRGTIGQSSYLTQTNHVVEDEATMKTHRLNQETANEKIRTYSNANDKRYQHDISSATSIVNEDVEISSAQRMHVKHDTAYNESSTEDINTEERVEEERGKIQINIQPEADYPTARDLEQTAATERQRYYNMEGDSDVTGSRISINVSDHMKENDIYEQNISSGQSNYNISTNNLMNVNSINVYNESGKLNPMCTTNKSISEQVINRSMVQLDPKLYSSFPVQGTYQEGYSEMTNDRLNIEQTYSRTNMTPVSREHLNSMQSVQSQRITLTPSKQNFRASYANTNGQSVMSIRPAMIVEQKSQNKKTRAPMCNFLNQCCGGVNPE